MNNSKTLKVDSTENCEDNYEFIRKIPREQQILAAINPSNGLLQDEKIQPCEKQILISNPLELTWQNLNIDAFVKINQKQVNGNKKTSSSVKKNILINLSGTLKPGQFTAILGPSGCGKTTLLNFLSGRLVSNNMIISGNILLNSQQIKDIDDYSNQIAYVTQDDILLATFTPYVLTQGLRIYQKFKRLKKVNTLIEELGLQKCKDFRIGNAIIRGISGGERKRTSIGVELLTNPSIIFLDEPTTGLDSATSLQVVELLKSLSHKGVNVVSTIHQPSSEMFNIFEHLILICRGNFIYQGDAQKASNYFAQLGYKCPEFQNPSDYFMKLMNEEGLMIELMENGEIQLNNEEVKQQFENLLKEFVKKFQESEMNLNQNPTFKQILQKNDENQNVSLIKQFVLLFNRSLLAQVRNRGDVLMKTFAMIVFAITTFLVYRPLGEGQSGIQNRTGAIFFTTIMMTFASIQGSIFTFSSERALFIKERLNKQYSVGPYFWSKNLAELPFHIFYPLLGIAILYFPIGFNNTYSNQFFIQLASQMLTYFYGASYGLFISVVFQKMEVALSLLPILVVPLMILGGFLINLNDAPLYLRWIGFFSPVKYGFYSSSLNEFKILDFHCLDQNGEQCNPIQQIGINQTINEIFGLLMVLSVCFRILAYFFMGIISTPKRPKLQPQNIQS